MKIKDIWDKFIESIIYVSGTLTTLIVFFIIYFLFKEGSGIFSKPPLEEGYSVVVNKFNKVNKIAPEDIKKIVEGEYTNWKQLDGHYDSIVLLTMSEIEYKFNVDDLGENFELLPLRIKEYVEANTGVIAIFPDKYLDPSLNRVNLDHISLKAILRGRDWYPTASPSPLLGALPIILGSLLVSLGAIALALPLGVAVAIYLAEIANKKVASVIKPIIELLAGVPSVVLGFFGLIVIIPLLKDMFNLQVGETALAGSIILGIISLPTIISLSEDAINSTPQALKNASLALGANQLQTIFKVTLPHAASGIVSASILGIGRAFGETMAVLMVTGNSAVMPTTFLAPVRTITATIASELGEATSGGIHYEALFILGCLLFVFTFIFNLLAEFFAMKQ